MCGIAGSIGRRLVARDGAEEDLARALAHRGPDGFGRFDEDAVSLLHWRLAVIDPSPAGRQPMTSHDGRHVIAYNGEVYDFPRLRAEVEAEWRRRARGAGAPPPAWRGRSDTEAVLEAYALWGPEVIERLNGIFAMAIYDREARRLLLARDRAGVKPLYVSRRDGALLFASEAKVFWLVRGFEAGIDARGISAYLAYGQCHGENHVLDGVRQLEPGELLVVDRAPGAVEVERRRFAPPPRWRPVERSDGEAAATLRRVLGGAVERQLVADVPVGVFLSGGVDSSILTALVARRLGARRTMAFTLGYPRMGADFDEIACARRVAAHLGVEHHVFEASQDDLVAQLERLVWHYDEPFADAAALNVLLLSRLIRSRVTVALAGEGSDELFGGYRRYQLEAALRALGAAGRLAGAAVRAAHLDRLAFAPRRVRILLRVLSMRSAAARYSAFLESEAPVAEILRPEWYVPLGIHPAIVEGYPDALPQGPVGHLCAVDQRFWLPSTYLEKSDKGGMASGLEVRVPYLDNEVVAFANSLPDRQRIRGRQRKWLLREAFGDLLPAEVFTRPKRGFGVPVARWLRAELRDYFADRVLAPEARIRQFVRIEGIERRFRDHVRRAGDYSALLWKCLVLEVWLRERERGFRALPGGAPVVPRAASAG